MEKEQSDKNTKKIQVPYISAWGKRDNGHDEAHGRFRFYTFLHGESRTTAEKNLIEDSGSTRFCKGKRNNSFEEGNRRFRLYTFLHWGRETTGMKKHMEISGSMLFCMGGNK